jgi:NAD(P)H-hydrate repair Nnr-like enzyme with NAD(P)H-hydrate epimerase domain
MNYNNLPKLLSTQDIHEADAYTIEKGISSMDLMEKAAQAFIEKLLTLYAPENVLILAGMGNNGGDAAAAARLLDNQGVVNQLYLVCFKENPSPDCRVNLKKLGSYREIRNQKDFPEFKQLRSDY